MKQAIDCTRSQLVDQMKTGAKDSMDNHEECLE